MAEGCYEKEVVQKFLKYTIVLVVVRNVKKGGDMGRR